MADQALQICSKFDVYEQISVGGDEYKYVGIYSSSRFLLTTLVHTYTIT